MNELVPLYRDPKSDMPVTQFNMKWVENAGLVKFDFLGLKTLTVLQKAVELVARRGIIIDLSAIPLDDTKSYDMMARGETVGVFQVESAGMRRALVEMKASRFEDIIALVALYRPGLWPISRSIVRESTGLKSRITSIPVWRSFLKKPTVSSSIRNR